MKSFRKTTIVIFALFMVHLLFAGDKPLWVIDIKRPGTSGDPFYYLQELYKPNSDIRVTFTHKNDILITFFRHEIKDKRKTSTKEANIAAFVALLLHGETGELIKRVEWLLDETIVTKNIYIHAFPEGGYLLRIGDNLKALDSSLNVIRNKTLEPLPKNQGYSIILPRAGYFFIVDRNINGRDRIYEIIDWRTFETVEKMNASDFRINDIWNNRLLGIDLLSAGKNRWLLEKEIGDSSWISFGHDLHRIKDVKYIYNGAIVVTCDTEGTSINRPSFWFIIEEGKRSDPVFYGKNKKEHMGGILPTTQSPLIAIGAYKLSEMRMFFDIGIAGTIWSDYWNVTTQQRLLRMKVEKDEIGGALSPDGQSLVILKKKKLEMYAIPSAPEKKK